jgi:hypothetical protein
MWPYLRDANYFRMLSFMSGLSMLAVVAVEAYAIWFVVYAKSNEDRDAYGIQGTCCTRCEALISSACLCWPTWSGHAAVQQ